MKRYVFLCLLLSFRTAQAQDSGYARKMVDTLASSYFWGRGYTKEGMKKAANFIVQQFTDLGLLPITKQGYVQKFTYPVNSFPGKMQLTLNGQVLAPGAAFLVSPASIGATGAGELTMVDSTHFINASQHFMVSLEDKLTWSVAAHPADYTMVHVQKAALSSIPVSYVVDIENKALKNVDACNVVAMVKGTAQPDSFIVFTAHYDHLGGMGDTTYFPGANDNASGVALLLQVASYYTKHPGRYSMVFIAFAGEEAGLLGSKYFTEHPLLPLKNIRFLLNTDLAGTGEEGITVVNATVFPTAFGWLQALNQSNSLLSAIYPRGRAANSDHYWFTEKKVPSFFIYTMGGIKAYHDVFDRPETLPLTAHENLVKLMVLFVAKITGS